MKDRLVALTVLFAGAAIAVAAPRPIAVAALVLPLVGLVVGPRLRLDRIGQATLATGAMLVGVLLPRVLVGPEIAADDPAMLGERTLLLAMPMLAVAAARTLAPTSVFGVRFTLGAALVALTAAGRALPGPAYPALAALALASGFAALHAADPTRPSVRLLGLRHVAVVAFGAAAAFGVMVLAARTLPRLHDAALARLLRRLGRDTSGFSDTMYLGELNGLLQSDTVTLRVRGAAPPLLRGAAFTDYAGGRWETDRNLPGVEVVETPPAPPPGSGLVEVEYASKPSRYFVPLDASGVVVATGVYERNALGVYAPSRRFEARRAWFAEGGGVAPLPPRPVDRGVPHRIRRPLRDLLVRWGADKPDPHARIAVILEHLASDYHYALAYERTAGVDPVVDFLTLHPEGHCEYFASALAILARMAEVPSRVVGGYRVVETSPFGYHIVRERHAHAWTELWLDDRWVTFDPTPAADLARASPAETPILAALADGLATAWERVDDWLGRRSAFQLSLILVGLVAALVMARVLRGRTRAARRADAGDAPLDGFTALSAALARRGVARTPSETLSRFARRVEDDAGVPAASRSRAADLVRRYELLRYAGRGDAGALDREMTDAARGLAARPSPRPSGAP
jgi:hypothetical protein